MSERYTLFYSVHIVFGFCTGQCPVDIVQFDRRVRGQRYPSVGTLLPVRKGWLLLDNNHSGESHFERVASVNFLFGLEMQTYTQKCILRILRSVHCGRFAETFNSFNRREHSGALINGLQPSRHGIIAAMVCNKHARIFHILLQFINNVRLLIWPVSAMDTLFYSKQWASRPADSVSSGQIYRIWMRDYRGVGILGVRPNAVLYFL